MLRPEIQECVLPGSPQQLADICDQEWECEAFILKQRAAAMRGAALALLLLLAVPADGRPPCVHPPRSLKWLNACAAAACCAGLQRG